MSSNMVDTILFLARPAREALALIHAAPEDKLAEPVWRLLLTSVFAAGAALTCAFVVIFGAPGSDDNTAKGDPVHMAIVSPPR